MINCLHIRMEKKRKHTKKIGSLRLQNRRFSCLQWKFIDSHETMNHKVNHRFWCKQMNSMALFRCVFLRQRFFCTCEMETITRGCYEKCFVCAENRIRPMNINGILYTRNVTDIVSAQQAVSNLRTYMPFSYDDIYIFHGK